MSRLWAYRAFTRRYVHSLFIGLLQTKGQAMNHNELVRLQALKDAHDTAQDIVSVLAGEKLRTAFDLNTSIRVQAAIRSLDSLIMNATLLLGD